jgi:Ca2+ transporting ATPase
VNAHNLASIPADCVVLGPHSGLKMDESALTGESVLISKNPGDIVLSGTTAIQGSAKMVVIAVGTNSVAGKIQAHVYESSDHDNSGLDGDEDSPLFVKLEKIAKQIGIAGTCAAALSLAVNCIKGFAFGDEDPKEALIEYFVTAITVLAVAVPEGLPLAVTLALAYSSNKMMKEQNLVKHLDACETMGCATTICTDKTGTLTANKMTTRAIYTTKTDFSCNDPAVHLGDFVKNDPHCPSDATVLLLATLIAIDTMDETTVKFDGDKLESSTGNPTEVALLMLVHQLGHDYQEIRDSTRGRSDKGDLSEFLVEGKQIGFSSARKMMSWVVPKEGGGYRIYCKGATEVLVARCTHELVHTPGGDSSVEMNDESRQDISTTAETYARRGMRTLGLAYKDLPKDVDFDIKSDTLLNSDGSEALSIETELVFVALVGIEDPLRKEVPGAIEKCYNAGIDVRLVTGDSPNTAVSIAYQAGILKDFHFVEPGAEKIAHNLKLNVLMEGKKFRKKVYRIDEDGNKEFDQTAFDAIWPHLRVLARSSPDDKLTLAHGLNQSMLFADKKACKRLKKEDGITIFPDRQVVAMTGDGTNDAPALKRADIGFAMGISGTQIAKDAADIILLDDNFASIVTAAKWGRNVYASIQKFLQFQLTVNIAAVVTALVGSFAYAKSPLAAIQLLWVNLIMDSLASLALASEPPTEELLKREPTNRSKSIIAARMWANMFGQATYQICVVMFLLFAGPEVFGFDDGHLVESDDGLYPGYKKENSVHYTLIFNTFVWMQLFNEVNSRSLNGDVNVFRGIEKNPLFCIILLTTALLQVVMVEFGGVAMHVHDEGLDGQYWAISMAFGAGSLIVQQVINLVYKGIGERTYHMWRDRKRVDLSRRISTMRTR